MDSIDALSHSLSRERRLNKKLNCHREVVWCFMSLDILLNQSRSFKITPMS